MKIESATNDIKERLIRYLDQTFPVKTAKPSIRNAFEKFQNEGLDFIKEPYLELATVYKEAGETLADLARSGELEPEVAAAFAKYLLEDDNASTGKVKLYIHQLNSLHAVGKDKKNLVVCTGTGSGKTECFLLPIVNEIFKQHKTAGADYHAHVRALILYPMNALVNDQIRRLRKLLKYLPGITFGRYINIKETKNDLKEIDYPDAFLEVWNDIGSQEFVQYDDNDKGGNRNRDENFLPD